MIILETKRLKLRTWDEKDIPVLTAINQDPKVCEFLPSIGDEKTTRIIIEKTMQQFEHYGFCLYAVELKSNHQLIGWTGLAIPSFEAYFTPAVEIGWRIASNYWNQGYATEAATAVLDYAFNKLNLNEIVSFRRDITESATSRHGLFIDYTITLSPLLAF